jgi:hypothetical protein
MDTDDLSDAAYNIILDARRINALLGAQLAVSGQHAGSETEFLRCMLELLARARAGLENYLGDDEGNPTAERDMTNAIGRLEKSVRALPIQPVVTRKPRKTAKPKAPTKLQGRYLAFIYIYTRLNGRPPAEADIQRFFRVTAPSVHQMTVTLTTNHFISRMPGASRSIQVLIPSHELPLLEFLAADPDGD